MNFDSSTIYQIYPLGFFDAPKENDGVLASRINELDSWIPYYKELGVDYLLFNPIFSSQTHGYDTRDYRVIDNRLGTNEDFIQLVNRLHQEDIKVILDGVFNHVGREFFAFLDVKEKKWDSPYKDWFLINFDGNSNYDDGFWYEGWEGHFELVKLNLKNPEVRAYLLDCVKLWITEFHIDGLRLDVAYSLDHDFMRELRSYSSSLNPDFVLIGEVLFGDYNLIVNEGMLQSCTNYECYKGIHSSFNSLNMFEISYSLNRQFGKEDWCLYRGKHLMNFVDNHDVSRIASLLKTKEHLPLAYALLFTMPGIPCLYYGSEWGATGVKEEGKADYDLRPHFDKPHPNELTELIKKLIEVHRSELALWDGSYENLVVTNPQLLFRRLAKESEVYVFINADSEAFTFYHDSLYGDFVDLLDDSSEPLSGACELPGYQFKILKRKRD
ncbi:maltodextrin glucosidase [Lachnospiraceae bacterium OttesenSCG-928-J05]|nr:maltodextrin glucosidase [Lachnospiraceae bacterium OttesenSCG-928-J05]